jgi:hypothetical protein
MLYGRILKEMGWLSKGDVVLRTPMDFIGSVLGASEQRTADILDAARGKVLVIDEANGLAEDSPFMRAVVATLLSRVQAVPGDDIAILLLGYKDKMEDLLRAADGGLSRRFMPDDAFLFEDYDDAALRVILLAKASAAGLEVPSDTADVAIALLARQRQKPNFGNGGAVENLLGRAKEANARRVVEADAAAQAAGAPLADAAARRTLLACDFEREPPAPPEAALAHLVGADAALAKLAELRATVAAAQAAGTDPWGAIEPCFVFKGPPGACALAGCVLARAALF